MNHKFVRYFNCSVITLFYLSLTLCAILFIASLNLKMVSLILFAASTTSFMVYYISTGNKIGVSLIVLPALIYFPTSVITQYIIGYSVELTEYILYIFTVGSIIISSLVYGFEYWSDTRKRLS